MTHSVYQTLMNRSKYSTSKKAMLLHVFMILMWACTKALSASLGFIW